MSNVEPSPMPTSEDSVYQRYAAASQTREEALFCPVDYSGNYQSVIPDEILEKDYGYGDPSSFAHEGETVLDLGSGGGKLYYILSQVVGQKGRVIGVDCNLEMLALARKYQQQVADQLGFGNVEFRYGLIQDLQLDLDTLERELKQHPVKGKQGPCLERMQAVIHRGPFKKVEDDDGHTFPRGARIAVCDKTFQLLQRPPYTGLFDAIEPRNEIPLEAAQPFACRRFQLRDPRETKGNDYRETIEPNGPCCSPNGETCC